MQHFMALEKLTVQMKVLPPELSIADSFETVLLLFLDDLFDSLIFHLSQFLGRNFSILELLTSREKSRRTKE